MDNSFHITNIRQIEAHFALNLQYQSESDKPIEIKQALEIAHKHMAKTLHVVVSVSSDEANQPFRFTVVWEGIFLFREALPKNDVERIANINCAAIIFPYIRESIADITRRANIPPFHLPPVNFVALHAQRKIQPAKAGTNKGSKKKKV